MKKRRTLKKSIVLLVPVIMSLLLGIGCGKSGNNEETAGATPTNAATAAPTNAVTAAPTNAVTAAPANTATAAPTNAAVETPVTGGSQYFVVADATGETTKVDCSALVKNEYVTCYQVTTAKDGKIVTQQIVEEMPVSVDTAGADKVEVAPVFFYKIGVAGEKGTAGYDINLPAGSYDFTVYNTTSRCDVYANDQILVNNLLQNGATPNYYEAKDIVIKEDKLTISTMDYSKGHSAETMNLSVRVVKSVTVADRAQKVYVLGDSLVAIYYNNGNQTNNLLTGWGQVLENYMTEDVDVVNLANSGAWAMALYESAFTQIKGSAQKGDILLLECGYNDSNKNYTTEEEMITAVSNMITEARELGVEVILVSPNASAHDYGKSIKKTAVMASLAEKYNAPFINLCELSYEFLYELYGSDTTVLTKVYNVSDTLHSTYKGAHKWASVVAGALYEMGYKDMIDTEYIFSFFDTVGNMISCNAVGKEEEGYAVVTFDANGQGSGNKYRVVKVGATVPEPVKPSAAGVAFDGWYKDAACTAAWDFATDIVNENTTIYAKWMESECSSLYTQDFNAVANTDELKTIATAQNTDALKLGKKDSLGNYLSYDFTDNSQNSRGLSMDFEDLDVTVQDAYVVEFDLALTPGNNQNTEFAIKTTDFANDGGVNGSAGSGYLLKLDNGVTGTNYIVNGIQKVEIPAGEWCHYTLYVDKTRGLVSVTINGNYSGVIADKMIVSYHGNGNVAGIFMRAGRYYAVLSVDNILVREVGEQDVFGEVKAEVIVNAEFASQLNTTITQPAEGSAVHQMISVKAIGNYNGDLTNQIDSVKWSVAGIEGDDGYISLTKEEGTGAGTDGVAPDGATAYFNVRNGVSNYVGYVKAEVVCGDTTYTLQTPFAVIGATASDAGQLAPATGYPANMDEYGDSLVGYVGTAKGVKDQDLILNGWSIYGSNAARTMELVKDAYGKKSIEFSNGGSSSGSTVAVYQWADQAGQYIIDFTAKFTDAMNFGVYSNTPNNGDAVAEWSVSYAAGALTLGTESISDISANKWYRFVISADASVGKVSMAVYDSRGKEVGRINDQEMTETSALYFCFQGSFPMYLNGFEAYLPKLSSMTVDAGTDMVKVPEAGEENTVVEFSAALTSTKDMKMTGAVQWSLAEEYANIELVSTGAQTADLKIGAGASGSITVVATKDGQQTEKTIQLTTSSNVVAFTKSTSSITIPFSGEASVEAEFAAETCNGSGDVIEGGKITYSLLAKDGVTETTVNGVTFKNGVLTVAAGASPAVVYVKATNEEGLSAKIKVNIHGLSFAFGSAEAADGFTQVVDTLYTETLGYGFVKIERLTVNEHEVTGTSAFRFKANVPNGNYVVAVNTTAAELTSESVEGISATTGITKSGSTFNVAVCDGALDLTFPAKSAVTSVEISQAPEKSALAKPMVYAIGDSTTKNNASGALSWGNCVSDGYVSIPVEFSGFANHGMAGRDSVGFYNQGRVEAVLLAICPGDVVTVNMGINSRETGEAAAYETLLSQYYVEAILQRGGIPIIVTATPDGPVNDRLASNYNEATGKFTNNRGNGARNDVLRKIAAEKGVQVIELGQWGEDWMNTLTAEDVTAYNAKYNTSFTTVLEMVQSWYVDHNHYKQPLGEEIATYILGELAKLVNP